MWIVVVVASAVLGLALARLIDESFDVRPESWQAFAITVASTWAVYGLLAGLTGMV